ncbi:uncharacterized protein [Drosophila takahashii]|uniref:uncharacterized protein n=1 Tax=Drosophila takahashii TaxID=29030 RepID=UPI001CF91D33|nr:uncharacterized protein LOC108059378 [Drosophila takahashii]
MYVIETKKNRGKKLEKKAKKTKALKVVEKKPNLLEDPSKLLTPSWFWNQYINKQNVPPPVTRPLLKVADPQLNSPVSNSSKLEVLDESGAAAVKSVCGDIGPCPPPPVLIKNRRSPDFADILTISRQRRLRTAGQALSIEEFLTKKEEKAEVAQPEATTAIEKSEENPEVPSPVPPVLETGVTDGVTDGVTKEVPKEVTKGATKRFTARDFEVVFKPESLDDRSLKLSSAEIICNKADRKLTNCDVLSETIRNCWHDDLEIQIESRFYYVDRQLFTYFARNFRGCSNSFLQIPAEKVPMRLLVRIYEWMLGCEDESFPIGNELIPFFAAAKFLGVQRLMGQYWGTFSRRGDRTCWELNAFHTFLMAREYRCPEIMTVMLGRVRKAFLPVVASREFLEMDANEVACLLSQDMLCVNSEDEVFFAAFYWLDFAWAERKKHAVGVMSQVRFALVSPWLRRSITNIAESNRISEIAKLQEVKDLIWEGTQYITALMAFRNRKTHEGDEIKDILEPFRHKRVAERFYTFCVGVPHHHDSRCSRYRELTFESFKRFLHRLHSHGQQFMDDLKLVPNKHRIPYRCCIDIKPRPFRIRNCPTPSFYTKMAPCWKREVPE